MVRSGWRGVKERRLPSDLDFEGMQHSVTIVNFCGVETNYYNLFDRKFNKLQSTPRDREGERVFICLCVRKKSEATRRKKGRERK